MEKRRLCAFQGPRCEYSNSISEREGRRKGKGGRRGKFKLNGEKKSRRKKKPMGKETLEAGVVRKKLGGRKKLPATKKQ